MKKIALIISILLMYPMIAYAGPEVDKTVGLINIESNWQLTHQNDDNSPIEYFKALETMSFVHLQVNPYIWQYIYETTGEQVIGAEQGLYKHAGLCGNQGLVFVELMQAQNVPTRTIQVYSIDAINGNNHVMAEVYFNNKWNLFDVTYATFFRQSSGVLQHELLSFEEVCQTANYNDISVANCSSSVYQMLKRIKGDVYPWAHSTTKDVVISGIGTIHLKELNGSYSLANIPNYIGKYWNLYDKNYGDIRYHLNTVSGSKIYLNIAGIGISDYSDGILTLETKNNTQEITIPYNFTGVKEIDLSGLDLSEGVSLSLHPSGGNIFYAVFSSITTQ